MIIKNVVVGYLVVALLFVPSIALGQAKEKSGKSQLLPQVDLIYQMVNLIVESNPSLQSQKAILEEIKTMPQPGAGFIDLKKLISESQKEGVKAPLLTMSQVDEIRNKMLDRKKALESARQSYYTLKNSLTSQLLTEVGEISKLKNKKENSSKLLSLLKERAESIKAEVKAGITEPTTLYDMMEKIMNLSVEIEDTSDELEVAKLQTALTLGGERWRELLSLLNQLK